MRAISLKQPWASLIAEGYKTIETRVWATSYRGPLLIVASQSYDKNAWSVVPPASMAKLKGGGGFFSSDYVPYGKAIAVVDILDCHLMTKRDEIDAYVNLYPGAYAWVLGNVRLVKPFPVKGQLRFYNVDDALIKEFK